MNIATACITTITVCVIVFDSIITIVAVNIRSFSNKESILVFFWSIIAATISKDPARAITFH